MDKETPLPLHECIFRNTHDGILIVDANHIITRVNPAFSKITGYTQKDVLGKTPDILKSFQYPESFYDRIWQTLDETGSWEGCLWNRRKNGEAQLQDLRIQYLEGNDDLAPHYVVVLSDVHAMHSGKEASAPYHDPLTQLPNRLLFQDRLDQALRTADRTRWQGVAVFYIDLDKLHTVNETYGCHIGDELLRSAAKRLAATFRRVDTVARIEKSQFAAICLVDGVQQPLDEVEIVAEKTMNALNEPYSIDNHTVQIHVTIGISLYPEQTQQAKTLMGYANIAMHQAKEKGGACYHFFQPASE